MPKTIGASAFYGELKRAAKRFGAFWEYNHKSTPENYPIHLPEAEWWDQFLVWLTEIDGKEISR